MSLNKHSISVMYKVFDYFDHDKKGYITIDDVERVMGKLEFLKNEIELPSKDKICESFDKFSSPESNFYNKSTK